MCNLKPEMSRRGGGAVRDMGRGIKKMEIMLSVAGARVNVG
jgi:hypothetical protein